MEIAYVDVPEEFTGAVIQKLTSRKGELQGMSPIGGGYTRLEFSIPSRGLIGYRGEFLTDTKGNGILNTSFDAMARLRESCHTENRVLSLPSRQVSLLPMDCSMHRREEPVYRTWCKGLLRHDCRTECKAGGHRTQCLQNKKLTNTRSSSSDEALRLTPPKEMSLEQCLDFIDTDELLEVTPTSLRIRKKILDPTLRKRAMISRKEAEKNRG